MMWPSLKSSLRDNSNEWSRHRVWLRNKKVSILKTFNFRPYLLPWYIKNSACVGCLCIIYLSDIAFLWCFPLSISFVYLVLKKRGWAEFLQLQYLIHHMHHIRLKKCMCWVTVWILFFSSPELAQGELLGYLNVRRPSCVVRRPSCVVRQQFSR